MKKYILHIIIFFAAVALIDTAFGMVCQYLVSHAKGGDSYNHYYIAKECDKDILIFGSSRAMHHYVPKVLEDSLGMSAYNCGVEANGIVLLYSRLLMMTNRYTPKVIIYDIHYGVDVAPDDNLLYLGWQKRFYDEPGVKEVFELVNPSEKFKMYSQLYRYNGSFVALMMDNIHPISEVAYGGYRAVQEQMTYEPIITCPTQSTEWDPVKKECMLRFVNLCRERDIKLILAFSPRYGGIPPECDSLIREFARENGLLLMHHYADSRFCHNKSYFSDAIHLNNTGANAYTATFASELKKEINIIDYHK